MRGLFARYTVYNAVKPSKYGHQGTCRTVNILLFMLKELQCTRFINTKTKPYSLKATEQCTVFFFKLRVQLRNLLLQATTAVKLLKA